MAVALTSTVNLVFGSQVLDPETGIIFNDEMDDFSTPGFPNSFKLLPSACKLSGLLTCGEPFIREQIYCLDNYPEPGKCPLLSIAPTIIEHADGSGGSRLSCRFC